MTWSYDLLWRKAQLYAQLTIEQDREGELFPLWAAFTLEFVARATLAHVHPGLLADPRAGGEHLLYAHGFGAVERPLSVPAKTLFDRCRTIVPAFTEQDRIHCMALIERRNAELHSGETAFAGYLTNMWLARFFRACSVLLAFQGKNLEQLFGADEAAAAARMVAAAEAELLTEVRRRIADTQAVFLARPVAEIERARATPYVRNSRTSRSAPCPACGSHGRLDGEVFRATEPRMTDGHIYRELMVLPTRFSCVGCGLQFGSHDELHHAELGGQYTVTAEEDPAEFYGMAYIEEDYGND